MITLEFQNHDKERRRDLKNLILRILVFSLLLGTIIVTGRTLAANISLNDSQAIQFGQGVTLTTSCDSNIEVTPASNFQNEEGAGTYKISKLEIADLDVREGYCLNVELLIALRDASGELLDQGWVFFDGVDFVSGADIANLNDSDLEKVSLDIELDGPDLAQSKDVYSITIETGSKLWGMACWWNCIFVKALNGIEVGSIIATPIFPEGLAVTEITPFVLSPEDSANYNAERGAYICGPDDNESVVEDGLETWPPCRYFSVGDSGFQLTLAFPGDVPGPFRYPQEQRVKILG